MTVAIFGLIGVIVGGVLNAVVSVVIEKRGQRAAGKVAARMLATEMEINDWAVSTALTDQSTSTLDRLKDIQWLARREILAGVLSDAAWAATEDYYTSVGTAREMLALYEGEERLQGIMVKSAGVLANAYPKPAVAIYGLAGQERARKNALDRIGTAEQDGASEQP